MDKLLLLSIVLAMLFIPIATAQDPDPRRGFRKMIWGLVLFGFAYMIGLFVVYPRLL